MTTTGIESGYAGYAGAYGPGQIGGPPSRGNVILMKLFFTF